MSRAKFSWNFVGAYPVFFAVATSLSMCTYNSIRNFATNPDVRVDKKLREDEMAVDTKLAERAKGYHSSFFRWIGEKRTIEKGGAGGSDCRVFQV